MKGQISIEFLTILSVFLIVFIGISTSLMKLTTETGKEIYQHLIWKKNKEVIETACKELSVIRGSKKTVFIRNPSDCNMTISNRTISIKCNKLNDYIGYNNCIIKSPYSYLNKSDLIPIELYSR